MSQKSDQNPADFIVPLEMNGMSGRMLHLPAPKNHRNREILYVYGHHSTIERWWGLAQNFNKYGAVTMPDLPGFGGMDSLYKIGKQPDLDTMADYLASFVKWRYKRKKVVIVGLSYGFIVVTRMLQRYPDLAKKVDFLISAVGFAHYEDFVFSPTRMRVYRAFSRVFGWRLVSFVFRYVALNGPAIRSVYHRTFNAKKKFSGAEGERMKRLMDMEVVLWQSNDVRTHWHTTHDMLTVDNCQKQVDLPVWHVSAGVDQYFNAHNVEQHMKIIFSEFHETRNKANNHTTSVIADAKEASQFIPPALVKVLLGKKS